MCLSITKRVQSLIRRCSARVKAGRNTSQNQQPGKTGGDTSRFGEKEFKCPECGKTMHTGVKNSHLESHNTQPRENKTANTRSSYEYKEVSRSDLIDSYKIKEREKKEEQKKIEIQEPTGGQNQKLKQKRYRKKWRKVLRKLEEEGEYVIGSHDYPVSRKGKGSGPRGSEAAAAFKSDFKRMGFEYSVEVEFYGGKSVIRVDGF